MQLAWGNKVSLTFCQRVLWIQQDLGLDASGLMACMAWESARTFSANVMNTTSHAIGLTRNVATEDCPYGEAVRGVSLPQRTRTTGRAPRVHLECSPASKASAWMRHASRIAGASASIAG